MKLTLGPARSGSTSRSPCWPALRFANLDLVESPSPDLHERFRKEIGRLEDDPADRLADLSAQLGWLRDTGFENVECHFKWLELTLMVATRPPDAEPLL